MKPPAFGICCPAKVKAVHDGDTLTVRLHDPGTDLESMFALHVRLLDCWAPELRGPEKEKGLESKRYLKDLLTQGDDVRVFVPFVSGENILAKLTTMGRVLGRIFVGERDVSELMVAAGKATKTKGK